MFGDTFAWSWVRFTGEHEQERSIGMDEMSMWHDCVTLCQVVTLLHHVDSHLRRAMSLGLRRCAIHFDTLNMALHFVD